MLYQRTDRQPEAIDQFLTAVKELPEGERSPSFNSLSISYYKQKSFAQARDAATQAITLSPNSYKPYLNRGLSRKALKDMPGAAEDFNAALAIDPNNADCRLNLAESMLASNNFKDAIVQYKQFSHHVARPPLAYPVSNWFFATMSWATKPKP